MSEQKATAQTPDKKGPSPIVVGFDYATNTQVLSIWGHKDKDGKIVGGHGYVMEGDKKTDVAVFFNAAQDAKDGQPARKLTVKLTAETEGGHRTVGYLNSVNSSGNPERPCYFDSVVVNFADKGAPAVWGRVTNACGQEWRDSLGFTQERIERPKKVAKQEEAEGEGQGDGSTEQSRPRQRA